jgi:hypothetical protein
LKKMSKNDFVSLVVSYGYASKSEALLFVSIHEDYENRDLLDVYRFSELCAAEGRRATDRRDGIRTTRRYGNEYEPRDNYELPHGDRSMFQHLMRNAADDISDDEADLLDAWQACRSQGIGVLPRRVPITWG